MNSHTGIPFVVPGISTVVITVAVDFIAVATSVELEFDSIPEFHLIFSMAIVVINLGIYDVLSFEMVLNVEFCCTGQLIGKDRDEITSGKLFSRFLEEVDGSRGQICDKAAKRI